MERGPGMKRDTKNDKFWFKWGQNLENSVVHPHQRIRGVTPLPRLDFFADPQYYFLSRILCNILPTTSASKIPLKIPTDSELEYVTIKSLFHRLKSILVGISCHTIPHCCVNMINWVQRMRHSKGTLNNHDGTPAKSSLENKFALLALLSDYSNSFNLYSVAGLSRNRVQNKTVNETFVIMF